LWRNPDFISGHNVQFLFYFSKSESIEVKKYASPILQPSEQHRLMYSHVAVCYMFRHDLVILWRTAYGLHGVFGTATRLRCSNTGRDKRFSSFQIAQTGCVANPGSFSVCTKVVSWW
jgi:hypothetical protein